MSKISGALFFAWLGFAAGVAVAVLSGMVWSLMTAG
jgi:hypothetical protein